MNDMLGPDEIDWDPLQPDQGSNYQTHSLMAGADRMEFHQTFLNKLLTFILLGVGGAALIATVPVAMFMSWWAVIPAGVGLLFSAVGIFHWKHAKQEIVFDLIGGQFRHGDQTAELDTVRALQLLSVEMKDSEGGRYWSCELNLVHHDGHRTHVMSHGDFDALRHDAGVIAQALHCEVWDQA